MRALATSADAAGARGGRVLGGALASLLALACNDRSITPPIDWPSPEQISRAIDRYNCIAIDGSLKCWAYYPGSDVSDPGFDASELLMLMARDELFPGSPLPPVDLGTEARALRVVHADSARCVVLEGEGVKCWGENGDYSLGLPDRELRTGDDPSERGTGMPYVDLGSDRDVIGIDAIDHGYCALFRSGRVKCWGLNRAGGLGVGDTETRGDDPGEMGDALPFVDLGTGVHAVGLSGTCIWTEDGRVKCWGDNSRGQLGVYSDRPPPLENNHLNEPEPWGEPLGDEPGELGDALPFVDLGTDVFVVQVAKAKEHACALTDDGRVKCWGANCTEYALGAGEPGRAACGRLGLGNREDRMPPLGDELPYVDLGTNARAVAIDAYDAPIAAYSCALLDDGRLKCWGWSSYGGLGRDDQEEVGDEPREMSDALLAVDVGTGRTVRAFRCGHLDTCAMLDDDTIKCWGGPGGGPYPTGDDLPPLVTREDLFDDP